MLTLVDREGRRRAVEKSCGGVEVDPKEERKNRRK
jgi:hypothetical protein